MYKILIKTLKRMKQYIILQNFLFTVYNIYFFVSVLPT